MKYDPKKKLFYYDGRLEEYKQAEYPRLHTILYQYDDDDEEFKIVDMADAIYDQALSAIKTYAEKKEEEKVDNVNHPKHYEGNCSIECIDAMRFALGDEGLVFFCAGNVFKYLWRYKFKNGEEDLQKAEWYSDKLSEIRRHGNWTNPVVRQLEQRITVLYNTVAKKEEEDEEDD